MDQIVRPSKHGVLLTLHVVPRAAKNELVGVHGGALKVRLTASPFGGAANSALVELLACEFGVARQQVQIISGETSRRKRVVIHGVLQRTMLGQLKRLVENSAAGR
jgi:uncharacterized protein (TIGR00251 family)